MKKLVLALMAVVLSLPAMAQEGPKKHHHEKLSKEERVAQRLEKMTKHLQLSEEQRKELEPLLLSFHQEEEQSRADRHERKEKLKAEMANILDEKQWAKMEEHLKDRKDKMHRGPKKHQQADKADKKCSKECKEPCGK